MMELSDVHAERGIIGCWLQGAICDDLDPQWIRDESRRILWVGVDWLRHQGDWHIPASDHPAHRLDAAVANAERIAHSLHVTGVWEWNTDPREELVRCLDEATMPPILDYYVERVRQRFLKIQDITEAERRLQQLIAEVV